VKEKFINSSFLIIAPASIHEGVAGIVAGNLKDIFGRPVAVLSQTESHDGMQVMKGSVRSVDGFDIIGAFTAHKELFIKLGGHSMAAGFTIPAENVDTLRELIDAEVLDASENNADLLGAGLKPDLPITCPEASLELALLLEAFEPTGEGNRQPLFLLEGVYCRNVNRMGDEGRHLRFSISNNKTDKPAHDSLISCVMFAKGDAQAVLPDAEGPINLTGSLTVNRWNGREETRFIVRDVTSFKQ